MEASKFVSESQEVQQPVELGKRPKEVLRRAEELLESGEIISWTAFFREVFGVDGIARQVFDKYEEMEAFKDTEQYRRLQAMITELRRRRQHRSEMDEELNADDPQQVITVRIPQSLRDLLVDEAKATGVSMNKLCISKLLQVVEKERIPSRPPSRRQRRRQGEKSGK